MSTPRPRVSTRRLVVVGVLVCLFLAGVVSYYASSHPDGLESVAGEKGFLGSASPHAGDGSPFAGYATRGIDDARLSGGVAGVVGGVLVLVLAGGLFLAVRRRDHAGAHANDPRTTPPATAPRRTSTTPSAATADVGAGHGHHLHFHGHSAVHRLPAHVKLVALVTFVLTVVLTPRTAFAAYAVYLLLVLVAQRASRVPFGYFAKRMVVEVPFVLFALLMPFVATGPKVAVGPLQLSEHGLLGAWALLAKGTLGVMASLVLATTTEPRHVVAGLEQLRLPGQLVQIMGFMVRYLEVVTGEMARMKVARESRGFRATSVRAWPVLATTAGALFIRSYERGERVHLAMLSRGYTGSLPVTHPATATATQWRAAGMLPAAALATLLVVVVR